MTTPQDDHPSDGQPSASAAEPSTASGSAGGAWKRRLGFWIGAVLLGASVVYVLRQRELLIGAWDALRSPDPLFAGVLVASIVGNVMFSAALFTVLTRRFGRVGVVEMQAVIASATLVNYLPLRPGMLGRIAYHHHVNKIRPTHILRTMIEAAGISIAVAGALALSLLGRHWLGGPLAAWIAAPYVVALAGLLAGGPVRLYVIGAVLRLAEVLLWAARYWAAFGLIGEPIGAESSLALACVSVIATMIPLVSNGLGVREWAIGLVAPMLDAATMALGITAELVNRAAELLVIAALGLAASWYLTARRRTRP